jgi:hypothetical protein
MADATKLRAKARALVQNVPYIAASMDALVDNVVGTGIAPRFTGAQAKEAQCAVAQWVTHCDADGRLDFYGMQAAAYRAMEQDGEVLVRLRPRRLDPTACRAAAAAVARNRLARQHAQLAARWQPRRRTGQRDDRRHRVRRDRPRRRLLAVGPAPRRRHTLAGTRNFSKRIPASSIMHLFDPKRPGQGRGITRWRHHRAHARHAAVRGCRTRAQESRVAPGRHRQRRRVRNGQSQPGERRPRRILPLPARPATSASWPAAASSSCRPAQAPSPPSSPSPPAATSSTSPTAAHHHGGAGRHVRDGHRRHVAGQLLQRARAPAGRAPRLRAHAVAPDGAALVPPARRCVRSAAKDGEARRRSHERQVRRRVRRAEVGLHQPAAGSAGRRAARWPAACPRSAPSGARAATTPKR